MPDDPPSTSPPRETRGLSYATLADARRAVSVTLLVTLISAFGMLFGLLNALCTMMLLFAWSSADQPFSVGAFIIANAFVISSTALLCGSVGLLFFKRWARRVIIVWAAIMLGPCLFASGVTIFSYPFFGHNLLLYPLPFILVLYCLATIYVLFKRNVRCAFGVLKR